MPVQDYEHLFTFSNIDNVLPYASPPSASTMKRLFRISRQPIISEVFYSEIASLPLRAWAYYKRQWDSQPPTPQDFVQRINQTSRAGESNWGQLPSNMDDLIRIDKVRQSSIQKVLGMTESGMKNQFRSIQRRYTIKRIGRSPIIIIPPMIFRDSTQFPIPLGPWGWLVSTNGKPELLPIKKTSVLLTENGDPFLHPHNSARNNFCLGTEAGLFDRAKANLNLRGMIEITMNALTSYNPDSPYHELSLEPERQSAEVPHRVTNDGDQSSIQYSISRRGFIPGDSFRQVEILGVLINLLRSEFSQIIPRKRTFLDQLINDNIPLPFLRRAFASPEDVDQLKDRYRALQDAHRNRPASRSFNPDNRPITGEFVYDFNPEDPHAKYREVLESFENQNNATQAPADTVVPGEPVRIDEVFESDSD